MMLGPESGSIVRIPLLDELLTDGKLIPKFQPIIELQTFATYGYEALARHRADTPFANPEILFEYGRRKRRLVDLDLCCLGKSLQFGAPLTNRSILFINIHPSVLSAGDALTRKLTADTSRLGITMDRLVLEITEQGEIGETSAAMRNVDALRECGVRFALDDVGVAYSHLGVIDQVKPSFLKISQHFGTDFEQDGTKVKIIRNIHSLAKDFGAELIVEGIEKLQTAEAARAMGIRFAQGYFFARPQDVEVCLAEVAVM